MKIYLDSSIVVASLLAGQNYHSESLKLLETGNASISQHGLLETFATLTGGKLGFRVPAEVVTELITTTVLPKTETIQLTTDEVVAAFVEAKKHGVRGGAVYDYIHLIAARKANATKLYTLNLSDFVALCRKGDPEVLAPGS